MKSGQQNKFFTSTLYYRLLVCSLLLITNAGFWILPSAHAKVYIDITSPAVRKLPISIKFSGPSRAREIEWIIKNDLETTGLFEFYDPDVPGAEIIATLNAEVSSGISVILSIQDVIENREVLRKRLDASSIIVRPMAHSISNDIYKIVTGKDGVFRTKISYLSKTSSNKKILKIMDWDGFNARTTVTRGLTAVHSWSHNGRYLLYSSERYRKWTIYILDRDHSQESILFRSKGLNLVGGMSADDRIAFSSSKDGSSEIYTINLFGKELTKVTRSLSIDVSPVFSPDGERIAFVSDRSGSPQIYVIKSNGQSVRRITFGGTYNTSPYWSPDGKNIIYVSRINGKNQIFMVKSDGADMVQLTMNGNNESPSFSPDGLFVAFDSDRDGNPGIYVMLANGEGQKRITPKKESAMSPKWSPYLHK